MSDFSRLGRLNPVYRAFLSQFRGLEVLPGDHRHAGYFLPALRALKQQDLSGALIALSETKAAAVATGEAAHHAMLRALVLMVMKNTNEASRVFEAALVKYPDHPGLHLLAGRHFIEEQRFTEAAKVFRRASELDSNCGAAFGALAVMYGLAGDWEQAAEPAARARALDEEFGPGLVKITDLFSRLYLTGSAAPDLDVRALDEDAEDPVFLENLPPVQGDLRAVDQKRPIIFVGCDDQYLAEYVPTLAYSLDAHREPVTLHLHIFSPGSITTQLIPELMRKLSYVALSLTWEVQGGSPKAPRNVYYSCARFVRAWQVLCANNVPVMSVDADTLFNRPVSQFHGFDGAQADISVCSMPDLAPAWELVIAGSLLFQPTQAARVWLGRVAAMIVANLGDCPIWFLDQIALSLAYERAAGNTRFLAMPFNKSCDTKHRDEAIVWAVTVDKTKESPFQARRRELLRRYEGTGVPENPNEVVQSAHGLIIINRNDMYIGPSIKATGTWCKSEMDVMSALIRPGDTVFDVGANFGSHTLAFSHLVGPTGKVFAFEPQRLVWQNLVGSLALNWIHNVHALNVAVGNKNGQITVPPISYEIRNNIGSVSLRDGWRGNPEVTVLEGGKGEVVPMIRLDDAGIETCRLIKVDVEGMEMEVLSGAADMIRRLRPVCYVEFHTDCVAITEFFSKLGYRLFLHSVPNNPNLLCVPGISYDVPVVPNLEPFPTTCVTAA